MFLCSSDVPDGMSNWEEIKDKDGLKVFSRSNPKSNINEVKVITTMNASLSALVYMVKRVEKQPDWAYSTAKAYVVRVYNNFHWVTYTLSDVPWPLSDRDCVTDVKMVQHPDSSITISSVSIDSLVDEVDGVVRLPMVKATWTFIPLEKRKTKVVFQILVKLGGMVPAWVANLFIEDGPFTTVRNFRAEVQKEYYKSIHYDFIKEKNR